MILVVGGISACQDDPAIVPDPDASSSLAISTTNATGMGRSCSKCLEIVGNQLSVVAPRR
jgi:hypothetical protein